MTQVDHSSFTAQQVSVEKLIKEQNFTWKVRYRCTISSSNYEAGERYDNAGYLKLTK